MEEGAGYRRIKGGQIDEVQECEKIKAKGRKIRGESGKAEKNGIGRRKRRW